MQFAKVEAKKKSRHVTEQLSAAIRSGVYQIGDRLPPERELATQMGVSRTAVREALSALQLAGVIESKTGSGSFIRQTDTRWSEPSLSQARTANYHPAHIWEARRILTGQVAELAAERLTKDALRKLKRILNQMETFVHRKDHDRYAEACEAFHRAIAEATKNPVIVQAMSFLFDIAKREWTAQVRQGYSVATGGDLDQCWELHRRILTALEAGHKEQVKALLSGLFKDIKENLWKEKRAIS
jgi:GntR family transcriptional repressor for pyruvate dehydrogenase complex